MVRKILSLIFVLALLAGCKPQVPAAPAAPTAPTAAPTAELPVLVITDTESTTAPLPTQAAENNTEECDNPFYPVKDEATWTYAYNQSGGSITYTMSVDENDAFVLHLQTDDGQSRAITIDGQCTREGIVLMDNPGAATTITDSDGQIVVSTIQAEGVTLPKDIKINDEWTQTLTVKTGDKQSVVHSEYTALGFENLDLPAGSIYALKVEQKGYVEIFGQKVNMHGYQWFAEGIGTVKSEMDGSSAVELVSYDIPD